MRHIVYYSDKAWTSGNFTDLAAAGRLDIACHTILQALFVSHKLRTDTVLHLCFNGPPDAPKHIEIHGDADLPFVKKDMGKLLKKLLYKGKKGREEVFPGYFVEKKGIIEVLEEQGLPVFIMDAQGEDIANISDEQIRDAVFVLGDDDGLPKEVRKYKGGTRISLGKLTYLASQVIAILHYQIDRSVDQLERP